MGKNGILKNKAGEQIFPATTADQVVWDKNTNLKQQMAKQDARISILQSLKMEVQLAMLNYRIFDMERMELYMIMLEKQLGCRLEMHR